MKKIIALLASLKTAIFLICALTLLAIIGTIIPQKLEAINYINGFPKTWQYILALGFDDMYRSSFFMGVLFLLLTSAVICVCIRSKNLYNKFSNKEQKTKEYIYNLKTSKKITKIENQEALKDYKISTLEDGSQIAFSSKGKPALIGGLILHIGLVLIFVGGFIGLLFGVEMPIYGKAGEKIPIPSIDIIRTAYKADKLSRQARTIRQFNPQDSRLDGMRKEIEKLHEIYSEGLMKPEFKVSFDRLWVENYTTASGTNNGIKSWNAELRFMDVASGSLFNVVKESQPQVIKVNYPISYNGLNFYLASWNKIWKKIRLNATYLPNIEGWESYKPAEDLFPQKVEVGLNESFDIKSFPFSLVVSHFLPDLRIKPDGSFFSASAELENPAAIVVAFDKEANCRVGNTWAFSEKNAGIFPHEPKLPLKFILENAEYEYECVIQMTYDPGTPLVWLGCIMFCLGMMFTFYITYCEEWIIINPDGSAFIAVDSNRAANLLSEELTKLENKLNPKTNEAKQ
ncbi:MAG: cytochrome c biogenesis protein ResB [Candidatus Riflebacteria bacterium]|nr:cytochrome c biogenesis protein ResB [Candidatus Riflebacteria bacterium]